jgi:hypothetical protein
MEKNICKDCIVKPKPDAYMDMTGKVFALRDIREGEEIKVEITSRVLMVKE